MDEEVNEWSNQGSQDFLHNSDSSKSQKDSNEDSWKSESLFAVRWKTNTQDLQSKFKCLNKISRRPLSKEMGLNKKEFNNESKTEESCDVSMKDQNESKDTSQTISVNRQKLKRNAKKKIYTSRPKQTVKNKRTQKGQRKHQEEREDTCESQKVLWKPKTVRRRTKLKSSGESSSAEPMDLSRRRDVVNKTILRVLRRYLANQFKNLITTKYVSIQETKDK